MPYDLITNVENCTTVIDDILHGSYSIVYYSCIPTIVISLLFGFFIFFKSKFSLISKILLALSITFSLWVFSDFVIWKLQATDSRGIMFFWALLEILDGLFFILSLYFVYVFIDKKDISLIKKAILGALLLPTILIVPTNWGMTGFSVGDCGAIENDNFLNYIFFVEIFVTLWIIVLLISRYRKAEKEFRKQIILLGIGIIFFLLSFFVSGYISQYFVDRGFLNGYQLEFYGLFGMTVFMGFLGYLIVRYKAFNIKLIAAQALVTALIILIASQFAYVQNFTNKILTAITFVLSVIGGYVLVKSVEMEVKRKEQLQEMSDKLSMANDQLRTLDNAKSEFISIASHQLRTPLTAAKGYASLLLEGSYGQMSEKQKDVINKMYQSNERLITLVEDMLNLSRIESGRMEYKFEKVEIEDVLQEVYDTFILKAKENNLTLELAGNNKPLPVVTTDRNKIREIISNFTDNAIKYTPSGGVKIKAYEKDGKLTVAVSDTGIGIPKDELPYLFEKFSRGKDISRLNAGGIGLGLHVGIKMIEELHGRIWVESEGAGKGSTFFVELPVG